MDGFLSTHVYGKNVILNASLQTDSGKLTSENFEIIRQAHSPDELNLMIQNQDKLAEQICDLEGNEIESHLAFTSFDILDAAESQHMLTIC